MLVRRQCALTVRAQLSNSCYLSHTHTQIPANLFCQKAFRRRDTPLCRKIQLPLCLSLAPPSLPRLSVLTFRACVWAKKVQLRKARAALCAHCWRSDGSLGSVCLCVCVWSERRGLSFVHQTCSGSQRDPTLLHAAAVVHITSSSFLRSALLLSSTLPAPHVLPSSLRLPSFLPFFPDGHINSRAFSTPFSGTHMSSRLPKRQYLPPLSSLAFPSPCLSKAHPPHLSLSLFHSSSRRLPCSPFSSPLLLHFPASSRIAAKWQPPPKLFPSPTFPPSLPLSIYPLSLWQTATLLLLLLLLPDTSYSSVALNLENHEVIIFPADIT